jgi:putative aminopeptidase FrvX
MKASGVVYNEEVDTQITSWSNLEVRVDELCNSFESIWELGIRVGDFISVDPNTEFMDNGFIISRHLDDKTGVTCVSGALKSIKGFSRQVSGIIIVCV